MARSAEVRAAKWTARMAAEALSPIMQRRLTGAAEAYYRSAQDAVALDEVVRAVLNAQPSGVAFYTVPMYFACGREFNRLINKCSGDSLAIEIDVIKTKWVSRGLVEVVVVAIRDALGVPEPIAP